MIANKTNKIVVIDMMKSTNKVIYGGINEEGSSGLVGLTMYRMAEAVERAAENLGFKEIGFAGLRYMCGKELHGKLFSIMSQDDQQRIFFVPGMRGLDFVIDNMPMRTKSEILARVARLETVVRGGFPNPEVPKQWIKALRWVLGEEG